MKCLFCRHENTDVMETRVSEEGSAVRRRRHCPMCQKRFTTYERIEEIPVLVVKKDGRRERFDREKLRNGLIKAVGKTNITMPQVEKIVSAIESSTMQFDNAEVSSQMIGEMVANQLKEIDKVAYIRFSSVFRRSVDVE